MQTAVWKPDLHCKLLQGVAWPQEAQKVPPNDSGCEEQAGACKAEKDSASNAISSLHIFPHWLEQPTPIIWGIRSGTFGSQKV